MNAPHSWVIDRDLSSMNIHNRSATKLSHSWKKSKLCPGRGDCCWLLTSCGNVGFLFISLQAFPKRISRGRVVGHGQRMGGLVLEWKLTRFKDLAGSSFCLGQRLIGSIYDSTYKFTCISNCKNWDGGCGEENFWKRGIYLSLLSAWKRKKKCVLRLMRWGDGWQLKPWEWVVPVVAWRVWGRRWGVDRGLLAVKDHCV